jgi:alpha-tubulin suppressor-like RCC1 family protein
LFFNAMITENHHLYLCGNNVNGELGLGYTSDYEAAFKRVVNGFPHGSKITSVCLATDFIAVIADGSLYMNGLNNLAFSTDNTSILGLTVYDQYVTTFTKVTTGLPQDKKVVAVSSGTYFTMAVMCDGSLYAVGVNTGGLGQLGFGISTDALFSTFTQVPLDDGLKVLDVSCGIDVTAIICNDGCQNFLYVCGNGVNGQLGLGNLNSVFTFQKVTVGLPPNVSVIAVSVGDDNTGVLLKDGTIYTTGMNNHGQLGNGTFTNTNVFTLSGIGLPSNVPVTNISCGNEFTDVIVHNNLYVCGSNLYGVLGQGLASNSPDQPSFVKVSITLDDHKVKAIYAGNEVNSIILKNNNMYTTGTNDFGALGQGIYTESLPQTYVPVFERVMCVVDQTEKPNTAAHILSNDNHYSKKYDK